MSAEQAPVDHYGDATTVIQEPPEFIPPEAILYQFPDAGNMIGGALFGDKNNHGRPPPKIRGSQFVKREQKIFPKKIIRNPWIPKAPPPQKPKP